MYLFQAYTRIINTQQKLLQSLELMIVFRKKLFYLTLFRIACVTYLMMVKSKPSVLF